MLTESIGQRIRTIRGKESRKSFAERMDIGTATLQRYEENERTPDLEFLVNLKNDTGFSLDYLVFGEDSNLSGEENRLLNNFRQADETLKLKISAQACGIDVQSITIGNVANQNNNTGTGDQFNAKKQKVDKRNQGQINTFNGSFGGDYVNGDKK